MKIAYASRTGNVQSIVERLGVEDAINVVDEPTINEDYENALNVDSIARITQDVILYNGNQITIYYDTNNWDFTLLGRIQGKSQSEDRSPSCVVHQESVGRKESAGGIVHCHHAEAGGGVAFPQVRHA